MKIDEAARIVYGDRDEMMEAEQHADQLILEQLLLADLYSLWKVDLRSLDEKCARIAAGLGLSRKWADMTCKN